MPEPSREERRKLTLDRMERELRELPVLPTVVMRMALLASSSPEFFEELKHLAEEDPSLAARILRAANAADQAPVCPIVSIGSAVTRLGTRRLASLLTALSVVRVFVPRTEAQRNLWIHAIQVAVGARRIAGLVPDLRESQEQIYVCGLLHDIGRFVMFEHCPEDLESIDETHWSSPQELIEAEVRICGYDHATLGGHALESWLIPEEISSVVRFHHVYHAAELERRMPAPRIPWIRAVQQADFLSIALLTRPGLVEAPEAEQIETLRKRCRLPRRGAPLVSVEELAPLVAEIGAESLHLAENLQIIGPATGSHRKVPGF